MNSWIKFPRQAFTTLLSLVAILSLGARLDAQSDAVGCANPGEAFGGQFGTPQTISDSIVVSEDFAIGEAQVQVDITHVFVGDVELDISSPGGTQIRLHDGGGGDGMDIKATFSDSGAANGSVQYDFGCALQPSGPGALADLSGSPSQGTWQLLVNDSFPSEDDGVLNSWCVYLFTGVAAPSPATVANFACAPGAEANTAQLFWSNPETYDELVVLYQNATLAVLPGSSTSYTTGPLAGAAPYEFSIYGVVNGATPGCLSHCAAQSVAVDGIEVCSSPGIDIIEGPHIDVINVTESVVVADVHVRVNIAHAWIGDIEAEVTSPGGATVRIHNVGGGEADDIRAVFADQGVANGSVPYDFGCAMQPSGPGQMSDLAGISNGSWTLSIVDVFPASDTGVLESWCVRTFENVPSSGPPAVENLSCAPGLIPGTAEVTWSNPVPYASIDVIINNQPVVTLPGDASSFTTASFPNGTILEIGIEGHFVGSAPSCRETCNAEVLIQYNSFIRGDVNVDGALGLPDVIGLLNHLFVANAGPLNCDDAADVNDDESLGLPDAIALLNYLFVGGSPPPAPGDMCGPDPTQGPLLTCQNYPPCVGVTDITLVGHVLRRIAFGPSPSDLERVLDMGVLEYIDEQLEPGLIDDSTNVDLQSRLVTLQSTTNVDDLYKEQIVRGLYSQKQLQEQLTSFWEEHFNTYLWTVWGYFADLPVYNGTQAVAQAAFYEHRENQLLRGSALGSFQGLVEASATSVTMLIYLDNVSNFASAPNENYARELLELHTMGVDNGYTQEDVEECARCFTGWTVCKKAFADVGDPLAPCIADNGAGEWSFHFNSSQHDYGAKTLFSGTAYELQIPARPVGSVEGLNDGFEVIAHLVTLPQTAEFVSTKLVQKFVSDQAPLNLIANCTATWLSSNGNIREVMSTILHSNEFLGNSYRWNKVETPFENVLGTTRAFGGQSSGQPELNALFALSQVPFNFFTPDGFPESGFDQLGTAKLVERIRFARLIHPAVSDPSHDLVGLLNSEGIGLTDVDAIVDEFLRLLYQGQHQDLDRDLAIEFLSTTENGVSLALNPAAPDYEVRLAQLAAFLAAWPQGQKQ